VIRSRLPRWSADFTWRGQLALALGLISAVVGFGLAQMIYIRVAVLLLFLPLVCWVLVRRNRQRLGATRRISPPRLQVGEDATVAVTVTNNAFTPCGLLLAADQLPVGLSGQSKFVIRGLAPAASVEAQYTVHGVVRGHYDVGPLTLRSADAFGMCAVDRSMTGADKLVVVPAVHALPELRRWPDSSNTSDTRRTTQPTAGADDLSVREYRRGDSLRRVNWRVTARRGELMVRQEEHPPQSRATILLDTRAGAHIGEGLDASVEFAITAVASIGVHLFDRRYSLHLVTENGAGLGGLVPEVLAPGPAAEGVFLDGLAMLDTSSAKRLLQPGRLTGLGSDALLIAVVGDISIPDTEELAARRRSGCTAIAVVLDVPTWGGAGRRKRESTAADRAALLRNRKWAVTIARAGDSVADVWQRAAPRARTGGNPPNADTSDDKLTPRGAA
jgi:uncharacterized protein (DUF58 family)